MGLGLGFGFGFVLRFIAQSPRLFFITCRNIRHKFSRENFNHQLYLYNGGLIYGKSAVGSREGGQGTYSSTQSYVYVSIFLHIPSNISIFPQISLNLSIFFHIPSINSLIRTLSSYISIYLVVSTLQNNYYVAQYKAQWRLNFSRNPFYVIIYLNVPYI